MQIVPYSPKKAKIILNKANGELTIMPRSGYGTIIKEAIDTRIIPTARNLAIEFILEIASNYFDSKYNIDISKPVISIISERLGSNPDGKLPMPPALTTTNGKNNNGKPIKAYRNNERSTRNNDDNQIVEVSNDQERQIVKKSVSIPPFQPEDVINAGNTNTCLYLINGSFFKLTKKDNYDQYGNEIIEPGTQAKEFVDLMHMQYLAKLSQKRPYDVKMKFTRLAFTNYIEKLAYYIQVFYALESIYRYDTASTLANGGLKHIRFSFDADLYDQLMLLKANIETLSVKPEFVNYIKTMSQNYSSNASPLSPVLKVVPPGLFLNDDTNPNKVSSNMIRNLNLKLEELTQISSLIAQVQPDWKIKLTQSSTKKIYDANFLTFWHNCCICYVYSNSSEEIKYTNFMPNMDSVVYYGMFTNTLRGEYLASYSFYDESAKFVQSGLFKPQDKFEVSMSYSNKTSLHCFNGKGIVGLTNDAMARSTFIHITPYLSNADKTKFLLVSSIYNAELCKGYTANTFKRQVRGTVLNLLGLYGTT